MHKHVYIINGSGGVGKDSICEIVSKFWKTRNISSITPISAVAKSAGWNGEKTPKARKFLSRLKEICTEFNDLSFTYCKKEYEAFLQSDEQILFVHIREPQEIERFRKSVAIPCLTLLVKRKSLEQTRGQLGNQSDDGVCNYVYDLIFENNCRFSELEKKVYSFFGVLMNDSIENRIRES